MNEKQSEESQMKSSETLKVSIEYLDSRSHLYGIGNPNEPNSIILHECTQKELKDRNDKGGKNYIVIAHLCVTQIFQYWEDYYRGLFAKSLDIDKSELN